MSGVFHVHIYVCIDSEGVFQEQLSLSHVEYLINSLSCSVLRVLLAHVAPRTLSGLDMKYGEKGFLCWSAFSVLVTVLSGGPFYAAGKPRQ